MFNSITGVEQILANVRNTPLKLELMEYINDLPDEILITIKPLLQMLIENTSIIESVKPDELTADEVAAHTAAMEDLERGDVVRHEDVDWVD